MKRKAAKFSKASRLVGFWLNMVQSRRPRAAPLYRAYKMMYVFHKRWQGYVFPLREAEELGTRAVVALVLGPAQ